MVVFSGSPTLCLGPHPESALLGSYYTALRACKIWLIHDGVLSGGGYVYKAVMMGACE